MTFELFTDENVCQLDIESTYARAPLKSAGTAATLRLLGFLHLFSRREKDISIALDK
jgi:hypothetical protein